MVDSFHVNDLSKYVNVFYNKGTNNSWQTWTKPRNISFVDILVIGAGGAGGNSYAAGNNSGGGGAGGGSGSITKGFFPANLLPDTLYIQVGQGGIPNTVRGGTGAGQGGSGSNSVILVDTPITGLTTQHYLLLANGGSGGLGGTSSTSPGVLGGAGGVVWTPASIASSLGIVDTFAGTSGGNGGNTLITPPSSVVISSIVSGGAGGGGLDLSDNGTSGASVVASGFTITIMGGIVGDGTVSILNGSGGFNNLPSTNTSNRLPMFFTGGSGGGTNTSTLGGRGGNGGNGGYGCGGGGGGASNFSTTSFGLGGRGGDGIVIITCY